MAHTYVYSTLPLLILECLRPLLEHLVCKCSGSSVGRRDQQSRSYACSHETFVYVQAGLKAGMSYENYEAFTVSESSVALAHVCKTQVIYGLSPVRGCLHIDSDLRRKGGWAQ